MNQQVLARKWRPHTFAEMVGQSHVLQALTNALDNQRLHHAYLFTGTRGVGKTTVARILAKALNCEQGIGATPCSQCSTCQEIDAGCFIDLLEVDAASRTKVEDTRELLENVQYAPTKARFKIYLIDEVHMLSGHSFNALLKTLEEPPAHVKFLLATTDPQKLPVTVLSRCLQFHLKNMLPEQISSHLAYVLDQEKITYDADALNALSQAADGSMRDALSLLDQAIAFTNGKVEQAAVHSMLGTIEQKHIIALCQALANHEGEAIVALINQLASQAADFALALADLLTLLHEISLAQTIPALAKTAAPAVVELTQQFSAEQTQLLYQIALIGKRDLPLAPNPKVGFEMVLLRMLAFQPAAATTVTASTKSQQVTKPAVKPQQTTTEKPAPKPQPTNTVTAPATTDWQTLLNQLKLTGLTQALASHCSLIAFADNCMQLELDPAQAPLLNDKQQQRLQASLSEQLGKAISLTITVGKAGLQSPASLDEQQQQAKQHSAEQAIKNDPNTQAIIDQFNATIAPGSIKPTDE